MADSYVIDASVVIEYLVEGTQTKYVGGLFGRIESDDQLIVPEFCLLECTNVIWKQVRFQGMSVPKAEALLRLLRKLPLRRVPLKATLPTALRIGLKHDLPIYDSAYVALAVRSGFPLITIDQLQSHAAEAEGVTTISVTDLQ